MKPTTPQQREMARTRNRRYRERNLEKVRERNRLHAREWRKKHPDKVRAANRKWRETHPSYDHRPSKKKETIKRRYGLTVEQYDAILAGPCALCDRPAANLDHCHETGRVRGGLCRAHNVALGQFGDDPERLEAAARYLRESDALAVLEAAA